MFVLCLVDSKNIINFVANIECVLADYLCGANSRTNTRIIYYGKEERYYAIQDLG